MALVAALALAALGFFATPRDLGDLAGAFFAPLVAAMVASRRGTALRAVCQEAYICHLVSRSSAQNRPAALAPFSPPRRRAAARRRQPWQRCRPLLLPRRSARAGAAPPGPR